MNHLFVGVPLWVWGLLCLALAAFIGAFDLLGGASLAKPVALLSLGVYLVFMGTLFTGRRALRAHPHRLLCFFPSAIKNITLFPLAWGEKKSVTASS